MIAGAGFAEAAWRLAISRVRHAAPHVKYSVPRDIVERAGRNSYPVHREYYKILDTASFAFNVGPLMAGGRVPVVPL